MKDEEILDGLVNAGLTRNNVAMALRLAREDSAAYHEEEAAKCDHGVLECVAMNGSGAGSYWREEARKHRYFAAAIRERGKR